MKLKISLLKQEELSQEIIKNRKIFAVRHEREQRKMQNSQKSWLNVSYVSKENVKKKKILAKHLICEQRKCEKDKISLHKRPEVSKEKGEKANFLCKGLETDVVHVYIPHLRLSLSSITIDASYGYRCHLWLIPSATTYAYIRRCIRWQAIEIKAEKIGLLI
ncbi:MAG: hypothetical protein ACOYBV_09370 [Candidatus Avilachnospira sp.]